jgi:hypothetical protein
MRQEARELWMMAVPARSAAQHGLRQQTFPPDRDQPSRIEMQGMERPESHRRPSTNCYRLYPDGALAKSPLPVLSITQAFERIGVGIANMTR